MVLLQGLSDCDSRFIVGRRYLVFARKDEEIAGRLTSSICLPTQPIEVARPALSDLGVGFQFASEPSVAGETRLQRHGRHLRASFLTGVAISATAFTSPGLMLRTLRPIFLLGPGFALFGAGGLLYFAIHKRLRILATLGLLLLPLLASVLTLQGYLFLRTAYVWQLLIDNAGVPP